MITIGRLARQFNLSRSTLLYYDRIGLLRPSGRSHSGYRIYTQADVERLQSICAYRDAGLNLKEIQTILDNLDAPQRDILENRLKDIGQTILALRQQQKILAGLLKVRATEGPFETVGKKLWVDMLRAAGMDEKDMRRWHQEFEMRAPQDHHDFLLALGIEEKEVRRIRATSSAPSDES